MPRLQSLDDLLERRQSLHDRPSQRAVIVEFRRPLRDDVRSVRLLAGHTFHVRPFASVLVCEN